MLKNRLPRLATVTSALLLVLTAVSLLACGGETTASPRPGFDRDTPTPEATAGPATEAPGATVQTAAPTATATAGPPTEPAEEPTQPPQGAGRPEAGVSPKFTSLNAGYEHVCGVKTDSSVVCWGATGTVRPMRPSASPSNRYLRGGAIPAV